MHFLPEIQSLHIQFHEDKCVLNDKVKKNLNLHPQSKTKLPIVNTRDKKNKNKNKK